jgi:hypothetical protein
MTTHEVLVKARQIQAEHGYNWMGYTAGKGQICPASSIAAATGEHAFIDVDHPAANVLAEEFLPEHTYTKETSGLKLSRSIRDERNREGREFSLEEILERFDRAIAKTAPEPDMEFLNEREVVAA